MKKILLSLIILGAVISPFFLYADTPTNEATPVLTEESIPFMGSYTGNCNPATDKDCYQLLEALPTSEGDLTSVNTAATGTKGGLGDFISFVFEIGVGIAGIVGVIMLTVYGFQYAANDKNIATFEMLKERITKIILGLLLLLSIFIILRTINPDLLIVEPYIDDTELSVIERASEPEFVKNLETVDISDVVISSADYDTTFLLYLTHQQGEGGAPAILWAAKNKLPTVEGNPFRVRASTISRNMKNNVVMSEYQKLTGTTNVTPGGFIIYWGKKIKGFKTKIGTIPPQNADAVHQASIRTGIDSVSLKTMCMIESYGCTKATARNGSYSGLFQLSDSVFKKFGEGGSIFDPYKNAYAAARYGVYNLTTLQKNLKKI